MLKIKLQTDKERLENEVNDVATETNNFKDELRLKTKAYNILNTTMKQVKADHDKDVEAAKAAKVDLMKDYWGRVAEAYRASFHDRGKINFRDKYFDGLEAYDAVVGTTSILPPLPKSKEEDVEVEEHADHEED